MKKIISISIFLMLAILHYAQNSNPDSLYQVYANDSVPDSTRIDAMSKFIAQKHQFTQPDSAIFYADLLFEFSKEKNSTYGIAEAFNIKGFCKELMGDFKGSLDEFNQALKLFSEIGNKKMIAGLNINIGMGNARLGNIEEAKNYFQKGIDLCREIGEQRFLANGLQNMALLNNSIGKTDEALRYFDEALQIMQEREDQAAIATILINIGQIYESKGNLYEAINLYTKSRKIAEKLNHKMLLSPIYGNLGGCHSSLGDYKEALKYYKKALALGEEVGQKRSILLSILNIGSANDHLGNLQEAIQNYKKALTIAKDISDKYSEVSALNNLSNVYQKLDSLEKSKSYAEEALSIAVQADDFDGINSAKSRLAEIQYKNSNYAQAISLGDEVLNQVQQKGDIKAIRDISGVLYLSYKETNRPRKALEMFELRNFMGDSLKNEENQKAAIKQQFQYDYEKQKELDDLENEKRVAIETQKKENQQRLSFAIGIGLLLISILALVIFNRLKITRQQKAIIEEQKKKVEQSEKYKEQFLANMSHEIRTPMHAISGMVKILERNEHPPSQDVYLDAMKTSSENLVVILNDVLDLSKIEAGKLDIESIPMNPAEVIENVVQILKYKAEEKGLVLNYQIDENVPSSIMGDPTRLNQILINLAGNAIKFTEKGSVDISLKKENDRLQFSIKDSGIGIPKEKIESIFGAFEQAKDSTTRSYGGTGLGLSISKQLVELLSGKIWAESEEGLGSTFFVDLPLVVAAAGAVSENIITEDRLKMMAASLEGIRVLLAEDNAFNQMIAQDDLSFFIKNVKIDVVKNGALAVEKFKTDDYDLILMDVQMPEMNGFEATQKIRELETNEGREQEIPIIAMTASLLKSEIENCLHAGMNNYIPKPYKAEELIGAIYEEVKP